MKKIVKLLGPYLLFLILLLVIDVLFFAPLLSGKELAQTDDISFRALSQEAKIYYEKNKKPTYWTNSVFGGMPVYTIYDPGVKASVIDYIVSFFSLRITGSLGFFIYLSIGAFIAFACLGVGPFLSFLGAIAISFATNHIGLMDAGHLLKIGALAFVPLILIGAFLLYRKKFIFGFACFTIGLIGSLKLNHIQMTYLTGIILAVYIALESFKLIKEKNYNDLIKSIGYLVAGTIIAVILNIGLLAGLKGYSEDTMRGGSILSVKAAQSADQNTASSEKGLGWDYAMQWSNGFADLLSMFAPGAVGGSSAEQWKTNSAIGRLFNSNGKKYINLPLYWGDLPFTSSPDYLGIVIIALFLLGLVVVKGPVKWFALISSVLLILLSMGKNFPILNRIVFDYLPYYNKFRTPNSILNVLSILVPVFSIYSLYEFMKKDWNSKELNNLFLKTIIPLGTGLLLIALIGPSLFDLKHSTSDTNFQSNQQAYNILLDTRADYMRKDFFRSFFILLLGAGALYMYAQRKLKAVYLLSILSVITILDLWTVAKRYVSTDKFQVKKSNEAIFQARPVDKEILADPDLNYRVFDLSVNSFNDASPSFHHKNIGGYHPAKLRRYQDMIDYYIGNVNMNVLSMLNTKYIIDQNQRLQRNPSAMGNAWFVSNIKTVNTPDEEISEVGKVDPGNTAVILSKEFAANAPTSSTYTKEGNITLTAYEPNKLVYKTESGSNQMAVFSEVWYGPNKGWQAYIDGKPVPHIRANYILRALSIPAGNHVVEFKFDLPSQMAMTRNISWGFGHLVGLALLLGLGFLIYKVTKGEIEINSELLPSLPVVASSKASKTVATNVKSKR